MKHQDHTPYKHLVEATEKVRLANDNLESATFAYFESPTDSNRQRLEIARREYLTAVEDRETLVERIAEAEAFEDDIW